ncbi:MAG TPA: hypothetical protein VMA71_04070 [Alloacidobacterium sp.]|nr:hypothetical protein [Alloacidobacterium sp.]
MPSISYPTELRLPGPWLIDEKSLEELDAVIDDCFEKMQSEADHRVSAKIDHSIRKAVASGHSLEEATKAVEEMRDVVEQQIRWRPDSRTLTIYLSGGRTVIATDFAELSALSNLRDEIARGFLVDVAAGKIKVRVSLNSSYSEGLTVDVSPDEDDLAQALFGKLQNWALDIAPPRWQKIWSDAGPVIAFIGGMIAILMFAVIFAANISRSPSRDFKQEARTLLKQGINTSNQIQALELLLAIESNYDSGQNIPGHAPGARYWASLCLVSFLVTGLATCPKTAFGLWKGRDRVKRGRAWIKILSYSAPLLVATRVIFPWFIHLFAGH